jgi:hypothetical protein
MSFNFRKYIPFAWKTKMPTDMEWEVHSLHAYKVKKEQFTKGEITLDELRQWEYEHRETEDQREFRWKQHHQNMELENQIISDYQNWKQYGSSWLGQMMDKGRQLLISKWWWPKPKKPVGKGKMWQSSITGQWFQEHKPDKSMNVRKWLDAANHGQAFKGKKNFNPDILKLDKPTEDMLIKSNEAKNERKRQKHELLMEATNNFGRGWDTIDRSLPGRGGGRARQVRVTFSDPRVYGGRDKVSSIKKTTKKK